MVFFAPVALAAEPLDQDLEIVLFRPQATLPRCCTGHSGKPEALPTALGLLPETQLASTHWGPSCKTSYPAWETVKEVPFLVPGLTFTREARRVIRPRTHQAKDGLE